jgi:hypothetical protein
MSAVPGNEALMALISEIVTARSRPFPDEVIVLVQSHDGVILREVQIHPDHHTVTIKSQEEYESSVSLMEAVCASNNLIFSLEGNRWILVDRALRHRHGKGFMSVRFPHLVTD